MADDDAPSDHRQAPTPTDHHNRPTIIGQPASILELSNPLPALETAGECPRRDAPYVRSNRTNDV